MQEQPVTDGVVFRSATAADVPAIVGMLADDPLGKYREDNADTGSSVYTDAFGRIAADANNDIIVAELNGEIAGCLQLTFIPGLSRRGALRAQIESVRVAQHRRNLGIGHAIIRHAIAAAKARGANILQLTSDKRRSDALRFYESLGFAATHEGMKLAI